MALLDRVSGLRGDSGGDGNERHRTRPDFEADEGDADIAGNRERLQSLLALGAAEADRAAALSQRRRLDVPDDFDEDAFFTNPDGTPTVTNRYDLERAVPLSKKAHFEEIERYWVNKPYAFVVIFHSTKENEKKYYLVEPHLTPIEEELKEFLTEKLRTAISYEQDEVLNADGQDKMAIIERETRRLLKRYGLESSGGDGPLDELGGRLGSLARRLGVTGENGEGDGRLEIAARPEPAVIEEDSETLSTYQIEKLLYVLRRNFVGYELIDGIKHDINVEDISCDGYDSPVFVYHTDYEQLITNVYHGESELDDFVVKLAQRSGKGISKRQPQVDATLPDGSRAQLTLGREVSDHGTNYTIRQFKDVPFTPIDLINWRTFSLDQMAFLWLAIENNKSLIFAGGTASGKTTSLNAVSLFIPSNAKIVSIEDTREVELPQRNWIASVTRPSFSDDDQGDIDEFDLLEAALRQRPDYIVMGEVRGEEGRTLFQVMSTGHTTYTTFHADSVGEVIKRFTTEPINVSKTLFTALDLVSIQTQTRIQGRKVRRSKSVTEINEYSAENDEINVRDVYQWRAESDEFEEVGRSTVVEDIKFDRGWSDEELNEELFKRRAVLAYLIDRSLTDYAQVAATVQAFIADPDTVMGLIANDELETRLSDLREMESVHIDIDPETEALVPRPDPTVDVAAQAEEILATAEEHVLPEYAGASPTPGDFEAALRTTAEAAADTGGRDTAETAETDEEAGSGADLTDLDLAEVFEIADSRDSGNGSPDTSGAGPGGTDQSMDESAGGDGAVGGNEP